MTREEEIRQAAHEFALAYSPTRGNDFYQRRDMLENMAKWADEHPKYDQGQLIQELDDLQFAYDGKCAEVERLRSPWRSLLDEMPPVKQTVLFLDTNGRPRLGYNNIDQKSATVRVDSPNEKVTLQYWMPIPELPKGGER